MFKRDEWIYGYSQFVTAKSTKQWSGSTFPSFSHTLVLLLALNLKLWHHQISEWEHHLLLFLLWKGTFGFSSLNDYELNCLSICVKCIVEVQFYGWLFPRLFYTQVYGFISLLVVMLSLQSYQADVQHSTGRGIAIFLIVSILSTKVFTWSLSRTDGSRLLCLSTQW